MWRVVAAHGGMPFTFQQDSAPAHRVKKTLDFLTAEGIQYWPPEVWPPNCPDVNPLDYSIWSIVAQVVCRERPPSVEVLKK